MTIVWQSILVFLTSALPIVESKGAVLLARLWHLPFRLSGPLCVVGSYIPVPFLLHTRNENSAQLIQKHGRIPPWLQAVIDRYGCWALLVVIAIPFTGVGCWLSALFARAAHLDKTKAAVCIFVGNLIAVVIMTGCIHGLVTGISLLLERL